MAPTEFKGLVPSSKSPHKDSFDALTFFAKDYFTLRTLIAIGAVAQIVLSSILPPRVAFLPAGLFTLYAIVTSATQTVSSPKNSYMDSAVLGRSSAQLPDPDTGSFGFEAAAHPIVVFHFGVRFNHPLGFLCPGGLATASHFTACNEMVVAKAVEYGMLGTSPWRAGERGSQNTLMMVYYFRDLEGLNKFAHDDIHRKAWDYLAKAGHKHIGFFHEAFCVPKGAYETIYANTIPLLMGQTSVKCIDQEGEEKFVRPIVSADVGPLRSQFGRMGRAFDAFGNSTNKA